MICINAEGNKNVVFILLKTKNNESSCSTNFFKEVLMKKKYLLNSISLFLIVILTVLTISCGGNKESKRSPRIRKMSKVSSPKNGSRVPLGQQLDFQVVSTQDSVEIDSFVVKLGVRVIHSSSQTVSEQNGFTKTGRQNLTFTVFLNNGKQERHNLSLTLLSNDEPDKFTYRKVNTYTHDPDAYVQGLFFDDGFIYESTGQRGESTLRKVDVVSGNVLQKLDIDEQFFGEGITLFGDHIFMLTWESRKGFVFNKNDFSEVRQFEYPTEGWGITTIGDSLVMTDETENLYFIDPLTFTEIGRVQVYDNKGPISALNELEYIKGKIYANVYQKDEIAIIDPESGSVEGIINLAGIFNRQNYGRRVDVLNGIAYDKNEDRLFVTGKYWPKLYEIELVPIDKPTI